MCRSQTTAASNSLATGLPGGMARSGPLTLPSSAPSPGLAKRSQGPLCNPARPLRQPPDASGADVPRACLRPALPLGGRRGRGRWLLWPPRGSSSERCVSSARWSLAVAAGRAIPAKNQQTLVRFVVPAGAAKTPKQEAQTLARGGKLPHGARQEWARRRRLPRPAGRQPSGRRRRGLACGWLVNSLPKRPNRRPGAVSTADRKPSPPYRSGKCKARQADSGNRGCGPWDKSVARQSRTASSCWRANAQRVVGSRCPPKKNARQSRLHRKKS